MERDRMKTITRWAMKRFSEAFTPFMLPRCASLGNVVCYSHRLRADRSIDAEIPFFG